MSRLKKIAIIRDDSYYTLDAAEKRVKEIEEYLKNNGWAEARIGLWQSPEYPNVDYVDTNSTSVTMGLNGFTNEHEGYVTYLVSGDLRISTDELRPDVIPVDANQLMICNLDGLKCILQKIK